MRTRWVALMLASCGRIGFDSELERDAAPARQDASPLTTVDAPPAPPGLFAWYPLDDDFTSFVARDISGNQRHARCDFCPTRVAGRNAELAARFDGATDHLYVTDIAQWGLSAFTVTAWIRLERRPSFRETIVARPLGNGSDASFAIEHVMSGWWAYWSPNNAALGGDSLPLDTWAHVAITFGNTTKDVHTNGMAAGSVGAAPTIYDQQPFLIGAHMIDGSVGQFFQGSVAHVMIFDRVLSPAEIAGLAQ